ncbi:PaaI family thioesterase [Peribacillus sp. TH14]|uniref:PaaI family thioesterase n=1 Tax=Peribacillus sp. TH14 TaxID=2798481 RepID=UPI00191319F4|nr:PaaI family thioesterase [Peribacillus sp. TH14]MBK5502678.1 PaaI family thioesterase [Peribacillus sp. TH14]
MDGQKLKQEINARLENCTLKELKHIQHMIHTMKCPERGGLHYLGRFLGINLTEIDRISMDLGMQNANKYGVAQGGAVYTLADVALGYKIISDVGDESKVLTIELKVNYMKQGKGRKLYAEPIILHQGKSTVVGQCMILDEQNDVIAAALGTFFVMRPTH